MNNPNKAITATEYGITICYTDSCKHYNIPYEKKHILANLQMNGNKFKGKAYQKNTCATKLQVYRAALYGLNAYKAEEVEKMSFMQKNKILTTQKKVQRFLDHWKQEICHQKLGSFLTTIFSRSTLAKELATYSNYLDEDNKNKMDFKDLGINRDMVIHKLITANLLPHNYYELK